MRNPDDRCGREDCGVPRLRHAPHFPGLTNSHAFVEPAPEAESVCTGCGAPRAKSDSLCSRCSMTGIDPPVQPDPDAAARAIAHRLLAGVHTCTAERHGEVCTKTTEGLKEARALGRDEGAREEREALAGIAQDRMSRCGHRAGTCRSCMEDGALIDIIVRRGKEGA